MSKNRVAARRHDRKAAWLIGPTLFLACLLFLIAQVSAAVGTGPADLPSDLDTDEIITGSIQPDLSDGTNVRMQYIQLDGPSSGHVKVVLSPDDRPLTMDEARSAARQAFLETLNDPFFMDDLNIVTIVVHRFPDQQDPELDFWVRFRSQGEGRWLIQDTE